MNPILNKFIEIVLFMSIYIFIALAIRRRKKSEHGVKHISLFDTGILFVGVLVAFIITKGVIIGIKLFGTNR